MPKPSLQTKSQAAGCGAWLFDWASNFPVSIYQQSTFDPLPLLLTPVLKQIRS